MPVIDNLESLFSIGQYSQCKKFNKDRCNKSDLYEQWNNSCKEISSQFMTLYLENDVITTKKTDSLVQELQNTILQIRSAPVNEKLLQIELSALYTVLYIKTLTDGHMLWNIDKEVAALIKQSLVRVIYQQNWRPCDEQEATKELLLTAIKQTENDSLLSLVVCICCLWTVHQCHHDKRDDALTLMGQCLMIQNLKDLVLADQILLPVSLLLTGDQYGESPSLSDVVNMTAGMVYYNTDHERARQCLQHVEAAQYKPYTLYLIGRLEYTEEHYLEVLTTLCSLPEDINVTDRVKALHCFLFGLSLSKLGKHQCAIQKYKEALEHDFDFLLPLFMISLEYGSLNMTPAELESLNLMATTLETVKDTQTHTTNSMFTTLLEDTCSQLILSQVLYALACRCSQLNMYDDASQRYLDLLSDFQDNDSFQIPRNNLVQIPPISKVYKEAIHCLHHAKKYTDCISVCDRILNCLPLKSHDASVEISHHEGVTSDHDFSGLDLSDMVDRSQVNSSQEGNKRKRQKSDESRKTDNNLDIDIYLYKADCLVLLDRTEEAVQCLDRCCDRIPYCASSTVVKVQQQSKRRRITSDGDASSHTGFSELVGSVPNFASMVYCHIGVAVATKGHSSSDALHFLHLALRLNPGNMDALYNYVVILWSSNKKEASVVWCKGRDIETVSDGFHLSNVLKLRQNKLRSMTGQDYFRETDLVPCNDVMDEQLLKLDVLCVNFLLSPSNNP